MTMLQLFDSVKLREAITLAEGEIVPAGTRGAVVELFQDGETLVVELFGDWIKVDDGGNFVPASADDPEAFSETIGLVTVSRQQVDLLSPAQRTVGAKHNSCRQPFTGKAKWLLPGAT